MFWKRGGGLFRSKKLYCKISFLLRIYLTRKVNVSPKQLQYEGNQQPFGTFRTKFTCFGEGRLPLETCHQTLIVIRKLDQTSPHQSPPGELCCTNVNPCLVRLGAPAGAPLVKYVWSLPFHDQIYQLELLSPDDTQHTRGIIHLR